MNQTDLFDLSGKTAVITGGGGVLGGAISRALAKAGATAAIADVVFEDAQHCAEAIAAAGGKAKAFELDVFQRASIEHCCEAICGEFGTIDILVNCVGGNLKEATTSPEQSFFDLPTEAIRRVVDLNLIAGTIAPIQVFGAKMKGNPEGGSIINISSLNAIRPLTRIPGYSAAKGAVSNFTQWLAVYLAQEYSPRLRVNAIAPGFFLTQQNRYLLVDDETGDLTPRGKTIIGLTPMGEFGQPDDLAGVAIWLASAASRFVTGIVAPVDGGFSAYSGV